MTISGSLRTRSLPGPGPHPRFTLYRLRQPGSGADHRPDSDVDVIRDFQQPVTDEMMAWWFAQDDEDFATVNAKLPGRLHIQYIDDPAGIDVMRRGKEVHRHRNIVCVLVPPKP